MKSTLKYGEDLFVLQEPDKGQTKFREGLENFLGAKRLQKCTNATCLQIHIFKYTRELRDATQILQNNYWQTWVVLHSSIRAFQHALLAFQWKCFNVIETKDVECEGPIFFCKSTARQVKLLSLIREATSFRCNQNMLWDWMILWKQNTCSCNQLITFPFPQLKVWKPPLLLKSPPCSQLAKR